MLADIYTLLKLASPVVGPPAQHRCSGCGLRWEQPATVTELCGDCWRSVQARLHQTPEVGPPAHETREELICYTCECMVDGEAGVYLATDVVARVAVLEAENAQIHKLFQNAHEDAAQTSAAHVEALNQDIETLRAERDALRQALRDVVDMLECGLLAPKRLKEIEKLLALSLRQDGPKNSVGGVETPHP